MLADPAVTANSTGPPLSLVIVTVPVAFDALNPLSASIVVAIAAPAKFASVAAIVDVKETDCSRHYLNNTSL